MYEEFFDLKRRPFGCTPDPTDYYPSAMHEEALALLRSCIDEGEGIAVLLGEPGVGKTLLCRMLLDAIEPSRSAVVITNTHMSSVQSLLQSILYDLSIPYEDLGEQELRLRLADLVMDRFGQASGTLLLVDEAQNLSAEQLEELRLMTNLEGRLSKAVQVVLLGQPDLGRTLQAQTTDRFRQRIGVVAQLGPLDEEQVIEYVRARIGAAGGSADSIFTANALCEICARSMGIPRRINQICHRSLLLAFAHESGTVDAQYVEAAMSQLWMPPEPPPTDLHHVASPHAPRRRDHVAVDEPMARSRNEEEPTVVEVGAGWPPESPIDARPEPSGVDRTVVDPDPRTAPLETDSNAPGHAASRLRQLYRR